MKDNNELIRDLIKEIKRSAYLNFPLRDDWDWEVRPVPTNLSIPPLKEFRVIDETPFPGWVWYGILAYSTPYGGFELEIETAKKTILKNRYSVYELYTYGLRSPTPQGWWVSQYSESPPLYVVAYTPNFPGTPFRKLRFKVINTSTTDTTTVYSGVIVLIRLEALEDESE